MSDEENKPSQTSWFNGVTQILKAISGAQLLGLAAIVTAATPIYIQQMSNHAETKAQITHSDSAAIIGRMKMLKSVHHLDTTLITLELDIDSLRQEIKHKHH